MLKGRATIQRDLSKLEEEANRNFIKGKYKVFCIWERKALFSFTAADLRSSSFAEKNVETLADSKLRRSQQPPLKQ